MITGDLEVEVEARFDANIKKVTNLTLISIAVSYHCHYIRAKQHFKAPSRKTNKCSM